MNIWIIFNKFFLENFYKYDFIIIVFLISFLSIIFAFIFQKKILRLFLIISFGIFFSIGVCEITLSLNMNEKDSMPKITYTKLRDLKTRTIRHILTDSEHLFVTSDSQIKIKGKVVFDVPMNVYQNGFRYTKGNINSDTAYVFMGCSYTFGHGVCDDETLPYYISEHYNFDYNIINCAQGGRSTNTAINILQSDVLESFLKKDSKVKYFIYSMIVDHIYRNFRILYKSSNDNYVMENGILKRVTQPFGFFKIIFAKSSIFNRLFLDGIDEKNRQYYENYMIKSFLKLNQIAKEKYQSELLVLVWPDVDKFFCLKLRKNNIDFIVLPPYLENNVFRIKNDGHPNAKANKKIADILIKYIEEQ